MSRLSTISRIELREESSWNNKIFLTFDIDWAHDDVLNNVIDIVEESNVSATWFVTHKTKVLERLKRNPSFELGIHPNFNFLLEGNHCAGSNAKDVVQRCLDIVPGATAVRSHSMAIGQCQSVIKDLGLKTIVMADTAGSAKYISEQENSKDAAIASKLAAQTYGLEIAKDNIQDMQHNTTRFLIMSKELQQKKAENVKYLTSCIFEVRSVPSALYKALGGFATNGVNITKLESFIVDGDFNKAQFYIDIDGHIEDKSVKGALEELDFYTDKLIVLGVYPMHEYRNQ